MAADSIKNILSRRVKEGVLFRAVDSETTECYACGHRCKIHEGKFGICKIRYREKGKLMVPTGYTAGIQLDPIEKKPFFHVYPGGKALSFGMLGCDLHCAYCQNWLTSQALNDSLTGVFPEDITPLQLVRLATDHEARVLTSTYNEPLITSEWAVEVFAEGKKHGLIGSFVSNGNATPEVLDFIRPYVDLYKVDLKSFDDKNYRKLGTTLRNVTSSIEGIFSRGFWLEIVTLVIPGFNDSDEELRSIAQFIKSISGNIPWHVTAFHRDYKMRDPQNTSAETLIRAARIGRAEGLRYVYTGNRPGETKSWENTYCPSCDEMLVEREGYRVQRNNVIHGACPKCKTTIPGVWS